MKHNFKALKNQIRLKNMALLSSILSSILMTPPTKASMDAEDLDMNRHTRVGSAFAGGGTRGILPLTIADAIEERAGVSIADGSDMMAGTSTGGFEAMGLSYGLTTKDLRAIYYKHANDIFPQPMFMPKTMLFLKGLLGPRYHANGLEKTLHTYFQDATFDDLTVPAFVVSYDMNRRSTILFDSDTEKKDFPFSAPGNFFLRDVLRATSAAPTYFSPAVVRPVVRNSDSESYIYDASTAPNICIDGGVTGANDPSAILYSKMGDRFNTRKNLRIIDFGTGRSPMYLQNPDMSSAGVLSWISPILDISLSSPTFLTNHLMNRFLGKKQLGDDQYTHYFDINPIINPSFNRLDETDTTELIKLQYIAEDWFAYHDDLIETVASIYRVRAGFKRDEKETFPEDAPSLSPRGPSMDGQIMSFLRRASIDTSTIPSPRRNVDSGSVSPRQFDGDMPSIIREEGFS